MSRLHDNIIHDKISHKYSAKEDKQILDQLYYGNHLEPHEIKRAEQLLHGLTIQLQGRTNR